MTESFVNGAYHMTGVQQVAAHTHVGSQILFVKSGRLHLTISNQTYEVTRPSIIFISDLERHAFSVLGDEYDRYYLDLSRSFPERGLLNPVLFSPLRHRPAGFRHVVEVGENSDAVESLFRELCMEAGSEQPFGDERAILLFGELMILLYRRAPALFGPVSDDSSALVLAVQRRLETGFAERITLTALAEEFHISACYLSHLFKRVTGYSVMQYLNRYRLAVARNLLAATNRSVTDIVFAAGFSDHSNFSRAFHKEMGCTPVEYRRRTKGVRQE